MHFRNAFVSSVLIGSLLSCQGQSGQSGQSNNPAPGNSSAPVSQAPAAAAPVKVEPAKLLLGRVRTSVIGTPLGKPEFVELAAGNNVTSGLQAAQLYATGRPVDVTRNSQSTNLIDPSDAMALSYPGEPYPTGYSSGYSVDWNWVLGGLLILGGAALIYYSPIGSYAYEGYQYSPYTPTPGYPQTQPYPYPVQP